MFAPRYRRFVINFRSTNKDISKSVLVSFLLMALALTGCATGSDSAEETVTEDEEVRVESQIDFLFPLQNFRRVSRGYAGRHRGVDVSAPKGTPIFAAESGWITYMGRKFRGYGKLIILEHSRNWATFYAHLNGFAVKEGSWVNKGDLIGYVGTTGRSTGYHLHFELRYKNKAIDPLQYFNQAQTNLADDRKKSDRAPASPKK